jgi:lipopolysaccharide transport system ATP-binding protein
MSDVILSVENVSKLYRLGTVGTGTFGGDVQRFWKTKILGHEDPFLKVGQINDRTSKEKAEFVWALQDINFEVKRGEVLGIIGKNGAGKSTLLKLLSRITSPTTGAIKSAGRMASLLEVGTGFHPELTGRENIFLNGAILGMTKKEIQSKFEEIVDFSGCEMYIDTPTKRYSSGMTVRLGFAVAAFLDPEILVVDEVLAVGDAEFQKKAIGKMKEVSQGGGRTVLFVSHNMASISQLCTRGLLIENGTLKEDGLVENVVDTYMKSSVLEAQLEYNKTNWVRIIYSHFVEYIAIKRIINKSTKIIFNELEKIKFEIIVENNSPYIRKFDRISITVKDSMENPVSTNHLINLGLVVNPDSEIVIDDLTLDCNMFLSGNYYCNIWIGNGDLLNYGDDFYSIDKVLFFSVVNNRVKKWHYSWGTNNSNFLKINNF